MKVVHVITGLEQGGAEAMLEKLVLAGRRLNPEIEQRVVNLGRPGVVGRRLESSGVTVDSLGMDFSLRVGLHPLYLLYSFYLQDLGEEWSSKRSSLCKSVQRIRWNASVQTKSITS